MTKAFEEIPVLMTLKEYERTLNPGNPQEVIAKGLQDNDGIVKVKIVSPEPVGETCQIWVGNMDEANKILHNKENLYKKGPTHVNAFGSVVPLHILITEGEQHAKLRNSAQRALARQTETKLPEIIKKHVQRLKTDFLDAKAASGETIENLDLMLRRMAIDILAEATFGEPWNALGDDSASNVAVYNLSKLMEEVHYRINDITAVEWRKNPLMEPVGSLATPVIQYVQAKVKAIEEKIAKGEAESPDQSMLEFMIRDKKNDLSFEELLSQCLTFMTMSHENIGDTTAWTLLHISQNDEMQKLIGKELLNNANNEEAMTATAQFKIKRHWPRLSDAWFDAIRLYPTVPFATRETKVETEVLGYKVPAGTEVIVPLYSLNRLSQVWGDSANKFNPQRFRESDGKRSKCPYVSHTGYPDAQPFGSGSRACIGQSFALLVMKETVLMMVKNYELKSTEDSVKVNHFVGLRPSKHGLVISPRDESSKNCTIC